MEIPEKVWKIPEPLSVHEISMKDGAKIILRRHGNPEGIRLILCHGNGLASDLYYPFWCMLMDDFDLIIYDLRNHGWNPSSSIRHHNVPMFIRDQDHITKEIDKHYGKKLQIGIFHSISAMTALLSPTKAEAFSALVLFDPPICSPGRSYADFEAAAQSMASLTRIRTSHFRNKGEFEELLPYSPTFRHVMPGIYKLISETTLRKSADGGEGYELCCPPEYEAQIIDYASNFAVLVDLLEIRCPMKVIGADPTLPFSYLPTFDLTNVVRANYDFLPETTHLLQLEQPEECVATMRAFLEHHNLWNPIA